jgi:hypothetical protein
MRNEFDFLERPPAFFAEPANSARAAMAEAAAASAPYTSAAMRPLRHGGNKRWGLERLAVPTRLRMSPFICKFNKIVLA